MNKIFTSILSIAMIAILTGCGGGKDSILAMKMFEDATIPFASLQYSHSVYGKAENQHNLIADVLEYTTPIKKHRISIYDDLKGKDVIFQCNTKELRKLADFLYKIMEQIGE
jgi:uncharacterized protein YozE (UPF0346 family)